MEKVISVPPGGTSEVGFDFPAEPITQEKRSQNKSYNS